MEEGSRTIRLRGELDTSTAGDLIAVLDPLAAEDGDVVLELSDLTFMDSSGLHVLLRTARDLDGRGRLILRDPTRAVRRILDLAGAARSGGLTLEPPSHGQ